jgi:hypothetical protein
MQSGYKYIVVVYGQNITDIAIQEYGCYEGIAILMEDNPQQMDAGFNSVTDPGTQLLIRNAIPDLNGRNQQIGKYLSTLGSIATNVVEQLSYIESDYIERDYIS